MKRYSKCPKMIEIMGIECCEIEMEQGTAFNCPMMRLQNSSVDCFKIPKHLR
jgi:hypothetical protein